jgi:hypothetical protein
MHTTELSFESTIITMFCNWLMMLGNLVSLSGAVVNQAAEHLAGHEI